MTNGVVGVDLEHVNVSSGPAQQETHVSVPTSEQTAWIIARIADMNIRLAQIDERLKKLDPIDDALTGNRLFGRLGLVAEMHRMQGWLMWIMVILSMLTVSNVALWIVLYILWR